MKSNVEPNKTLIGRMYRQTNGDFIHATPCFKRTGVSIYRQIMMTSK